MRHNAFVITGIKIEIDRLKAQLVVLQTELDKLESTAPRKVVVIKPATIKRVKQDMITQRRQRTMMKRWGTLDPQKIKKLKAAS